MRALLIATLVAGLSGCMLTPIPVKIDEERRVLQASASCCVSLGQITPLELVKREFAALDDKAPIFRFDERNAYVHLYRLPAYSRSYSIYIHALYEAQGSQARRLRPELRLYDASFVQTRRFAPKDARPRGHGLEHAVFVNASNAGERYLAVIGSSEEETVRRNISHVQATPVMGGNFYTGVDIQTHILSAPLGTYSLDIQGLEEEKEEKRS